MELPLARGILIYFLVINLIDLIGIRNGMYGLRRRMITQPIFRTDNLYWIDDAMRQFNSTIIFTIFLYGIGTMILVLKSFSQDKENDTGRFLMLLPYTLKERMKVKLGMGFSALLIGVMTLGSGMFIQRIQAKFILMDVVDGQILKMAFEEYITIGYIMKIMLVIFLSGVGFYLFLVMMQYIINYKVSCMISSILIFYAPLFILFNCKNFECLKYNKIVDRGIDLIIKLLLGPIEDLSFRSEPNVRHTIDALCIGSIENYTICWCVLIVMMAIGIFKLSKTFSIDRNDIFIPNKVFRWIYVVGFTVCGSLLMGDIYLLFAFEQTKPLFYLFVLVGFVISGFIGFKIGHIGLKVPSLKQKFMENE